MEKTWVKVLQALRSQKNFALFGLVSSLDDIEFTTDQIIIHSHNAAEKNMLTNHLALLKELAGGDVITITDNTKKQQAINREYVAKLKELFGDKVEIL